MTPCPRLYVYIIKEFFQPESYTFFAKGNAKLEKPYTIVDIFDREERSGSGPKKGKVDVLVVVGDLAHFPKIEKNCQEMTRNT